MLPIAKQEIQNNIESAYLNSLGHNSHRNIENKHKILIRMKKMPKMDDILNVFHIILSSDRKVLSSIDMFVAAINK